MKIEGVPGEYAFPAAYNYLGMWEITDGVFHSKEEAEKYFSDRVPSIRGIVWPVEKLDNGSIYIVSPEEMS